MLMVAADIGGASQRHAPCAAAAMLVIAEAAVTTDKAAVASHEAAVAADEAAIATDQAAVVASKTGWARRGGLAAEEAVVQQLPNCGPVLWRAQAFSDEQLRILQAMLTYMLRAMHEPMQKCTSCLTKRIEPRTVCRQDTAAD